MTAAMILARSGEGWKSGPIGLAVILALCVALYFLFKSMSKHLRKVREEFPADDDAAAERSEPAERSGPAAPADPSEPSAPDGAAEGASHPPPSDDRPPNPS